MRHSGQSTWVAIKTELFTEWRPVMANKAPVGFTDGYSTMPVGWLPGLLVP